MPQPEYTIDKTLRRLAERTDPAIVHEAFGGKPAFDWTLREIRYVDRHYGKPQLGRDFFNAATDHGKILADKLQDGVLKWQERNRPSLPALAEKMLGRAGIKSGQLLTGQGMTAEELALGRYIMLIAARAEMVKGQPPQPNPRQRETIRNANPYHDTRHTASVAVVGDDFGELHQMYAAKGYARGFSRVDRLTIIAAAFKHDVDHPGRGNPVIAPMFNEEHSFACGQPLMAACGVPQSRQDDMLLILRTTSINGPHDYLKKAATAWREGRKPVPEQIDPDRRFPMLDELCRCEHKVHMAAVVQDADLYTSAGGGLDANIEMSERLSRELRATGIKVDFTTDNARMGFFNAIVGKDGFSSPAVRYYCNEMYEALRCETEQRLQAAPKP